ncbi:MULTISPECIES: M23 family metallopeptidase [Luteimonas]|uniref:M23 family metallopeptidase n=1 Tax=Luteimonas TaxID=83614 RepID=UPI000C7AE6F8|nr:MULTISPECIES: M23 family metallopeptidase [Luteimonas]
MRALAWLGGVIVLLVLANVAGWWWRSGRLAEVPAPVVSAPTPAAAPDAGAARPASTPPAAVTLPERIEPPPPPALPTPTPAVMSTPSSAPAGALLVPVQGVPFAALADTFDDARGSERRHEALDIMAPAGTPVVAIADGTIEKLFDSERGGLTIYQFEPSGRFAYYYAHLQAYAPGLAEGAQVRQGDVLGTVGSTGNADPAAPHLHFAIFRLTPEKQWWTGEPVNPYPLLRDAQPPAR